jgi:hypothetical protein
VWAREDDFGWDDVYAQRIDSAGNLVDSEILVNVDTHRDQTEATVIVESDGDFAIAWRGPSLPDINDDREPGSDIFFRRFDAAGVPEGDPIMVNETEPDTQTEPVLAINASGDCWAAWRNEDSASVSSIVGREISGCITPSRAEVQLNDPTGDPTLRGMSFVLSNDGAITAVFVKDDTNEGDGSVNGYALGQPEGWLFFDGFESGDITAWSATMP